MALLETNDWMVLNNIIYQINYLKDSLEMRENLLKQLLLIIDFDSANFFVTDSEDPRILKNMAGYNFSEKLGEDLSLIHISSPRWRMYRSSRTR